MYNDQIVGDIYDAFIYSAVYEQNMAITIIHSFLIKMSE